MTGRRLLTVAVLYLYGLYLCGSTAWAAVDGTVTNATSGKPAANVSVALVQPGQGGMKTLGETKADASGAFSLPQNPTGPALLQVTYQGVTYTKFLMPGAPATGLKMDVYDSTKKPVAQVSQHMTLIQPTASELQVNDTYLIQDTSKETYDDPAGTLKIYLPPGFKGEPMAQVTYGQNGVPVPRPALKTKQPNIYAISYPMRPGETRVDLSYSVPAATPAVFEGKILQKDGKHRLVVPNGVTLKGEGITEVGKEPQSQATIYDVTVPDYKVEVAGTGSLAPPEPTQDAESEAPQITEAPPHIYNHIYWIMGLAFGILGLGSCLLARNSPAPAVKK